MTDIRFTPGIRLLGACAVYELDAIARNSAAVYEGKPTDGFGGGVAGSRALPTAPLIPLGSDHRVGHHHSMGAVAWPLPFYFR